MQVMFSLPLDDHSLQPYAVECTGPTNNTKILKRNTKIFFSPPAYSMQNTTWLYKNNAESKVVGNT